MNKKGMWALALAITLVVVSAFSTFLVARRGGRGGGRDSHRSGRHHSGRRHSGYRRGGVRIGFGGYRRYPRHRYAATGFYPTWRSGVYPGEFSECKSDLRACYRQNDDMRSKMDGLYDEIDNLREQVADLKGNQA